MWIRAEADMLLQAVLAVVARKRLDARKPNLLHAFVVGRRLCVAVGILAGLSTCAGHLTPFRAAEGGTSWRELATPHFRLRTDESSEEAQTTLAALERLRSGLLTVFHAPDDFDTGQMPVIAVDNGWTDFADREVEGFYAQVLFQPWIVLRRGSFLGAQETIKHELVHFLSSKVIPDQPPWLAEGLATYFQTAEEDAEKGLITVGRPPQGLLSVVQHFGLASVADLFATRTIGHDSGMFYASAWAVVHFLTNHHAPAFAAYQRALAGGLSHEDAWRGAFPSLSAEELGASVRNYLDGGQYELLSFRTPTHGQGNVPERALPEADVHAMRALLILTGYRVSKGLSFRTWNEAEVRGRARKEVDEALAADPGHSPSLALAHFELGVPLDGRIELARQHRPSDWLTSVLWVQWLGQQRRRTEQKQAIEELETLVAKDRSVTVSFRH